MDIKDQIILVSGAAGSVGSYVVSELSPDVKKLIAVDSNQERLSLLGQGLDHVEAHHCNLTEIEEATRIIEKILLENRITVLINLAGAIHSEPLINLLDKKNSRHSVETWDQTIKSNLYTTFFLSSMVAESMVKNRTKGVIINISSVAAQGNAGQTAYGAAKAGIESMTKVWSKELGMFRIRCACIAPGFFNTPSTHNSLSESTVEKWKKVIPIGRLGELSELMGAVRFIIQNDYYSGKILRLDGGLNL